MRALLVLALLSICAGSALAQSSPAISGQAPWLGVGIENGRVGVRINEVIADTPADIVGILLGDEIVSIGDTVTRSPDQLVATIRSRRVGERVRIAVARQGRELTLWPELTTYLDPQELLQRRLVDKEAPPFSLPRLHGKASGDLAMLRGKVVIIEFWSSWCEVCKASFESLASFEAEHLGDVVVLAITAESKSQFQRFLGGYAMALTVLQDARGQVNSAYRCENRAPTVVVIGRDGFIRHADTGPNLSVDDLLLSARRALQERLSI